MIKNMILINSANFIRAEFDLSKETFFVGSNAGGKTTSIRALHFLYNSDPKKLGIPSDKTSFKKHYYPYDNSYIIYTFKDFFIFTYKRGDEIHRYFSKQAYDQNRIFGVNNSLKEFDEIIKYIKESSWHHPKTIEEYTDILYGKNKKYLDFSISNIKHYEIFIEILNLVFNVDAAIVDSISIKRAIQKALKRDDEIVTLDFEKYIKKLKDFETSYYFFKTFDKHRKNIDMAVALKNELLTIEEKINIFLKMIQYRKEKEQVEEIQLSKKITLLIKEIDRLTIKKNGRRKIEEFKIPKLESKVNDLKAQIIAIEKLKEKYALNNFEENSKIANNHNGIKEELQSKNFQLQSLKQQKMSVIESYDRQIKELKQKIQTTIPHETEKNIRSLANSEEISYNEAKKEKENEITQAIRKIKKDLDEKNSQIESLKNDILHENDEFRNQKKSLQDISDSNIEKIHIDLKIEKKKQNEFEEFIEKINKENQRLHEQMQDTKNKYTEQRSVFAMELLNKRKEMRNQIEIRLNQIATKPGTFKEFLANEVINWEKEIYPIIDKKILLMPIESLNPRIKENSEIFGIDVDTSMLDKIPTPQEARDQINVMKKELYQYRVLAHEKFKEVELEKNQFIAELESKIEENKARIENAQNEIKTISGNIFVFNQKITDEYTALATKINQLEATKNTKNTKIDLQIKILEDNRKTLIAEQNKIENEKKRFLTKLHEDFEFNIKAIEKEEHAKKEKKIQAVNDEIIKINHLKKAHDKDDLIATLTNEVTALEKENEKCILAKQFLEDFEAAQKEIKLLYIKISDRDNLSSYIHRLKNSISNSLKDISKIQDELKKNKEAFELSVNKYKDGFQEYYTLEIELQEEVIETEQFLVALIKGYKNLIAEYKNKKADLKSFVSKIGELESYPLLEVDLSIKGFDEAKSVANLLNIIDALNELEDFKSNKYESQKKRSNREFNLFLNNTLPQKLTNFGNLENEFLEIVDKVNKNLQNANFGVVRDISLETKTNSAHKDSVGKLFENLGSKIKDSANLYSKDSLFFHDIPKSVKNIEEIIDILGEIKKRGTEGTINLFDAIELSISYIENGKKNENRMQIKNDSSSGGNILLKVAIAISILNIYYKPNKESEIPFYLIIDEISRLQHKNQTLLRDYINSNGFKTLFITPDALYPDLDKAIYYIFKNIENEGESLRVTQMNKKHQ